MSFVETRQLSKTYLSGKIRVTALIDVTISLEQGAFLGVTGPSGSGKSTLMNLLGGLDTPTSGSISVAGTDIAALDKDALALYRRNQVGMIFQSFNLIPSYTAAENVAFPLLFSGVGRRERTRRAEETLSTVDLTERAGHKPAELSGGEQQRVAVARALINQPRLLLADEPTGNLDSATSRGIVSLLSDLNKKDGLTVIMISHEQDLLREFAHTLVCLRDGRIAETDIIA
jgi:putative ABC transport system ATP-binding protein